MDNSSVYQRAKDLIADKKITEARTILSKLNEDKARKWIAQLDSKYPPKKKKPISFWKTLAMVLTPIVLLIVIGFIIATVNEANWRQARDKDLMIKAEAKLKVHCLVIGVSDYSCAAFWNSLNESQLEEIRSCTLVYDNDSLSDWAACASRRGVLP